eukprot:758364-Hanusia_phi.AAC.1
MLIHEVGDPYNVAFLYPIFFCPNPFFCVPPFLLSSSCLLVFLSSPPLLLSSSLLLLFSSPPLSPSCLLPLFSSSPLLLFSCPLPLLLSSSLLHFFTYPPFYFSSYLLLFSSTLLLSPRHLARIETGSTSSPLLPETKKTSLHGANFVGRGAQTRREEQDQGQGLARKEGGRGSGGEGCGLSTMENGGELKEEAAVKSKAKRLNDTERLEIIAKLQGSSMSQRAISREYGVSEGAIRKLLKQKNAVILRSQNADPSKMVRTFRGSAPHYPAVEEMLFRWVDGCQKRKVEVSPAMAIAKATELARGQGSGDNFKASWKWFSSFRRRRGLLLPRGEVSKTEPDLTDMLQRVGGVIANYAADHVYSVAETGLLYRMLPHHSLLAGNELSTGDAARSQHERIALLVCANATGSHKIPCAMVGRAVQPASAQGCEWATPYLCQKQACVDGTVLRRWFEGIFVQSVRQVTSQPVVLLINDMQRMFAEQLESDTVKVVLTPACLKQAIDQELIANLKRRYKFLHLKHALAFHSLNASQPKESAESVPSECAGDRDGKLAHLVESANFLKTAWESIAPDAIRHSFIRANLGIQFADQAEPDAAMDQEAEQQEFNLARLIQGHPLLNMVDLNRYEQADQEDAEEFKRAVFEEVEAELNAGEDEHDGAFHKEACCAKVSDAEPAAALLVDPAAAPAAGATESEGAGPTSFSGWKQVYALFGALIGDLYHPSAAKSAGEQYETIMESLERVRPLLKALNDRDAVDSEAPIAAATSSASPRGPTPR